MEDKEGAIFYSFFTLPLYIPKIYWRHYEPAAPTYEELCRSLNLIQIAENYFDIAQSSSKEDSSYTVSLNQY